MTAEDRADCAVRSLKLRLSLFWEPGVRGDDVPVLRSHSRVGAGAARRPDSDGVSDSLLSLHHACLSVTFISPSPEHLSIRHLSASPWWP